MPSWMASITITTQHNLGDSSTFGANALQGNELYPPCCSSPEIGLVDIQSYSVSVFRVLFIYHRRM
jgi:hypothetical protein